MFQLIALAVVVLERKFGNVGALENVRQSLLAASEQRDRVERVVNRIGRVANPARRRVA